MTLSKHWAAVLDDYVIDLAWSPDGAILAAASAAGDVTLFDAATGTVRHVLAGHENGTNCIAWMPAGRVLRDEPRTGSARPASAAKAMEPTEESPYLLATGGQDGFVRFWSGNTGQQTAEVKIGTAWVEHLVWVGRVVPNSPSNSTTGPASAAKAVEPTEDPPCLFAAAGKKLVALGADGSVLHTFPDAPKTISALALTPAARISLTAPVAREGPPADKPRAMPARPSSLSKARETTADSPCLAAACFGNVSVWDAGTFAAQKEFTYGNSILALVWSPNGRWLVAGCQDNAVHLWAPAEDVELHMSGYEAKLQELSFSPDSKWLATGGGRDACVWDCAGAGPADREPLLLPHKARVCAVAFQHKHSVVATGATDGEFCLWAPTHRNPLVAEVKLPSAATKFAWRADDSLLAAGTEKGTVFVFKL
jgi:WD40 repeat protein